MHLGFHIYDVGFQSPERGRGTARWSSRRRCCCSLIVVLLNLFAISMRNRLRRKYATSAV